MKGCEAHTLFHFLATQCERTHKVCLFLFLWCSRLLYIVLISGPQSGPHTSWRWHKYLVLYIQGQIMKRDMQIYMHIYVNSKKDCEIQHFFVLYICSIYIVASWARFLSSLLRLRSRTFSHPIKKNFIPTKFGKCMNFIG